MQLCDAHGLPILFLADTPGFMVGPEAEKTATVRHVSRMFVTGANLSVPTGTVVLRKGYGLGAQAMAGGSFKAPLFCVAWPTGGVRRHGPGGRGAARDAARAGGDRPIRMSASGPTSAMVAEAYERGSAINMAAHFELDDVIDPADTRRWVAQLFDGAGTGTGQHIPRPPAAADRHLVAASGLPPPAGQPSAAAQETSEGRRPVRETGVTARALPPNPRGASQEARGRRGAHSPPSADVPGRALRTGCGGPRSEASRHGCDDAGSTWLKQYGSGDRLRAVSFP